MARAKNSNLHSAKKAKNDEFYTQIYDIENELKHYKKHFKDKVIFLNCDDPEQSNFWKYFEMNFEDLGVKKVIATHYNKDKPTYKLEMTGLNKWVKTDLEQNGDFRSSECVELLKEADIVVTNPPFSLFREYVAQLMEYEKKFLIIGNQNALTYKEIFPLIQENKIWLGHNSGQMIFRVPDGYESNSTYKEGGKTFQKFGNIAWFTNLEHKKRHKSLVGELYKEYSPEGYPKYDNCDAINVDKVADIPVDYFGVMGVPITFIDKYNSNEFEIIGLAPERLSEKEASLQIKRYENAIQHKKDGTTCSGNKVNDGPTLLHDTIPDKYPYYTSETVKGKYLQVLYARILIRRKVSE